MRIDLPETCSSDDITCLATAASDKLGLEAIRALHQQLDDDANGNIDISETSDVCPFACHDFEHILKKSL